MECPGKGKKSGKKNEKEQCKKFQNQSWEEFLKFSALFSCNCDGKCSLLFHVLEVCAGLGSFFKHSVPFTSEDIWDQVFLCEIQKLFFQLKFTFSIILYQLQVHGIVVRKSYTLQSASPPDISSTQLAPYIVITILLTIFPMLYFTSCDYFVTTNLYFLISSFFQPVS